MSSVSERTLVLPLAYTSHLPVAAHFSLNFLLIWSDKRGALFIILKLLFGLSESCLVVATRQITFIWCLGKIRFLQVFGSNLVWWAFQLELLVRALDIRVISLCWGIWVVLNMISSLRWAKRDRTLQLWLKCHWRWSSELTRVNIEFKIVLSICIISLSGSRWVSLHHGWLLVKTRIEGDLLWEIWLSHWYAHAWLHVLWVESLVILLIIIKWIVWSHAYICPLDLRRHNHVFVINYRGEWLHGRRETLIVA